MALFQAVQTRINVTSLLNDTMLHVGGYATWQDIVDRNRLSTEEAVEHQTSIEYWTDLYDAATTPDEQHIVRLRMSETLSGAYIGADRRVITEDEFLVLIGYTAEAASKKGRMPPHTN